MLTANRLGNHAGLVREQVYRSGALSDVEVDLARRDSEADSDSDCVIVDRKISAAALTKVAASVKRSTKLSSTSPNRSQVPGVPVPPHKPRSSKGTDSLSINEYLQASVKQMSTSQETTSARLDMFRQKMESDSVYRERQLSLQEAELEESRQKARYEEARGLLDRPGLSDALKAKAEAVIEKYLEYVLDRKA